MKDVTFITGNQSKADYLAKYLGMPVEHRKLDLDEIQSVNLKDVVEHKVRQAYEIVKSPVLVEDVALEFTAFGRIPGPFIKFFETEMSYETICRMLDGFSKEATGRCMFGYFDGQRLETFEGEIKGVIADHPAGDNGFGWDKIFIPEGYDVTRALLNENDYRDVYMKIRPFEALAAFLRSLE